MVLQNGIGFVLADNTIYSIYHISGVTERMKKWKRPSVVTSWEGMHKEQREMGVERGDTVGWQMGAAGVDEWPEEQHVMRNSTWNASSGLISAGLHFMHSGMCTEAHNYHMAPPYYTRWVRSNSASHSSRTAGCPVTTGWVRLESLQSLTQYFLEYFYLFDFNKSSNRKSAKHSLTTRLYELSEAGDVSTCSGEWRFLYSCEYDNVMG